MDYRMIMTIIWANHSDLLPPVGKTPNGGLGKESPQMPLVHVYKLYKFAQNHDY